MTLILRQAGMPYVYNYSSSRDRACARTSPTTKQDLLIWSELPLHYPLLQGYDEPVGLVDFSSVI